MRRNVTNIFLETYHYALTSSVTNDKWLENIIQQPEIINEHFDKTCCHKILSSNRSLEDFLSFKNKNNLRYVPTTLLKRDFNKKEIAQKLIQNLFQKTSYFAHMIKNLLDEFADKKRIFASYKIYPLPEKESDTYFPVKKFKVASDNGDFVSTVLRNGMSVQSSNNDDLKDYFVDRCLNKSVKTAYVDKIDDYDKLKRKLVFVKFLPVNDLKVLSTVPSNYKIKYYGNQTVKNENNEFSISREPINIFYLEKIK